MKTLWFKGESPEEQKNIKNMVLSSTKVLDKLREMCYNSINDLSNVNKSDYSKSSWAYEQAHRNGMAEAYRTIAELCKVTEE